MKIPVLFFGLFLLTVSACQSQSDDVLNIGGFTGIGAVGEVAEGKGFFDAEQITVRFNRVSSSKEQMRNLISGDYDIVQTNADNIVAWAEGQGADPGTNDFIIFLGGYRGLARDLIVAPTISDFADLRGEVLAVDAVDTGYATVLVYMLRENGLTLNSDYTLQAVGNTALRTESMKQGDTVAGFIRMTDELEQMGFRVLARTQDYLSDYARNVAAARRDWAEQNHDLLVRYIRAMVRATDWLRDPQNREEAIAILASQGERSRAEAERAYEQALDPDFGFIPCGRIERPGIDQIIRLREIIGAFTPPLPSPEKYIDEQYYQEAIRVGHNSYLVHIMIVGCVSVHVAGP
jgi:ABC-type nitrate/sulfonate/bicarbonate transport system substrate-binding protein